MTDISAALGLASLDEFDQTFELRRSLLETYVEGFKGVDGIELIGGEGYEDRVHAAWLCTVLVDNRRDLQIKLLEEGIESNQVHYRNDRYSIFGGRRNDLQNLDELEYNYLVLPLHTAMKVADVERIVSVVKSGW